MKASIGDRHLLHFIPKDAYRGYLFVIRGLPELRPETLDKLLGHIPWDDKQKASELHVSFDLLYSFQDYIASRHTPHDDKTPMPESYGTGYKGMKLIGSYAMGPGSIVIVETGEEPIDLTPKQETKDVERKWL